MGGSGDIFAIGEAGGPVARFLSFDIYWKVEYYINTPSRFKKSPTGAGPYPEEQVGLRCRPSRDISYNPLSGGAEWEAGGHWFWWAF